MSYLRCFWNRTCYRMRRGVCVCVGRRREGSGRLKVFKMLSFFAWTNADIGGFNCWRVLMERWGRFLCCNMASYFSNCWPAGFPSSLRKGLVEAWVGPVAGVVAVLQLGCLCGWGRLHKDRLATFYTHTHTHTHTHTQTRAHTHAHYTRAHTQGSELNHQMNTCAH